MKTLRLIFIVFNFYCISLSLQGQSITVNTNKTTATIQPTMWGIFFEDINFAADGGVYAELVKNRSFEFFKPLMGWEIKQNGGAIGSVLVVNRNKAESDNPRFIKMTLSNDKGNFGLMNEGFRGMGIKKNLQYNFSVWAKPESGNISMHVQLIDSTDNSLGESSTIRISKGGWQKYNTSFTATATSPKAKMMVWFGGKGVADFDMISLFPQDTWKERPGGLRADLVQLLADMKPGFIRFPGGCIVEGRELATRYQWKKTIGPLEDRKLIVNRWNTEIAARPAPDYFQTLGLGFFEYFQLAEDIGASPLPILNCGMACQFNTAEVVDTTQLDPYVQDALDLIEFANGDTNTKWGTVRARLGHPAPFNLKMIGVGNENWGPQYIERFKVFQKTIKKKYPEIKTVASTSAEYQGERFNYLIG